MDPIAARVTEHLDRLSADYRIFEIDPDLADTAAFCERYGYSLDESANAILVASKRPAGVHALCLALATTRLDVNHTVRALMDVKKLSFAPPETTVEVTGMEIGGVTPFGLEEIPIYVDSRITALATCIVGAGSRSYKIELDPEVFLRMEGIDVVEGLAG